MSILKISKLALAQDKIIDHLARLRQNSFVDSSDFSVAAIVELSLVDGSYAYASGVNVENSEHNRLGMHAEQTAIVAAQSLLGGNTKFSKIWIMGAPRGIVAGSEDPLANNQIQPCGHCRQILLAFSSRESKVYSVTVNGAVGDPKSLADLLPDAFSSEGDLTIDESELSAVKPVEGDAAAFPPELNLAWQLLERADELSDAEIRVICAATKPHVINPKFKTGAIQVCLIRAKHAQLSCYFPGVLVQDIAFLTTDAVFASVAQAITEFGGKGIEFQEIHLYGSLDASQLSVTELRHLSRFSSSKTLIKFHSADTSSRTFGLDELRLCSGRDKLSI